MKKPKTLGEREIIEIIQNQLDRMPKMPIPFGDDVAACDLGNNELAVLKTDMLVGKTDVPKTMSLWQAARKAVVMNISDFAAKGVKPQALMVSLGLPRGLTEKDIAELGRGLNTGAREYGAYIIGGDTGEASDLIISITVFGTAKKENIMLRNGAKPGDIVAVTGLFGKTAAGLKILTEDLQMPSKMREDLVNSVLMPHARLKEGLALGRTMAVTAAIDSSDGLAWSLHEIAKAGNVGFVINKVPTDKQAQKFAESNKLDPTELTLYGGEEYELVLTIKQKNLQKAKKATANTGCRLLPIGIVTKEKQIILNFNEKARAIKAKGYEHFKTDMKNSKVSI
jgi:thiamine-monophosphate kinase